MVEKATKLIASAGSKERKRKTPRLPQEPTYNDSTSSTQPHFLRVPSIAYCVKGRRLVL
jgi:hypothetical protein